MPQNCSLRRLTWPLHTAQSRGGYEAGGRSAVEAALNEAILLLTARGASLETQGEPDWTTPLGQAVVRGDLATARALAKAGASLDTTVSKRGRTLEQAAEFYLADEASRGGPISRREAMLRMIAELGAGGDGSEAMAAYFVDSLATAGIHRSHAAARLAQWLVASEVDVHASLLTEVRQQAISRKLILPGDAEGIKVTRHGQQP